MIPLFNTSPNLFYSWTQNFIYESSNYLVSLPPPNAESHDTIVTRTCSIQCTYRPQRSWCCTPTQGSWLCLLCSSLAISISQLSITYTIHLSTWIFKQIASQTTQTLRLVQTYNRTFQTQISDLHFFLLWIQLKLTELELLIDTARRVQVIDKDLKQGVKQKCSNNSAGEFLLGVQVQENLHDQSKHS